MNEENNDSVDALLKKYDRRSAAKNDDVTAMQAVICILIAAAMFAANFFYPERTAELYRYVRAQTECTDEVIPNPVDAISELL